MSEPKAKADPIDARLVRRLAAILNDTGLTEIEVERGDLRIKVARNGQFVVASPTIAQTPLSAPGAPPQPGPPIAAPEPRGEVVKSPMVGTVYLQPEPGAPPAGRCTRFRQRAGRAWRQRQRWSEPPRSRSPTPCRRVRRATRSRRDWR